MRRAYWDKPEEGVLAEALRPSFAVTLLTEHVALIVEGGHLERGPVIQEKESVEHEQNTD